MGKIKTFHRQHDSTDCGPTCLRIISNFYGKDFPLEFLREKSYVGKNGVSLQSVNLAAESIGFETLNIKIDLKT